jgi:phosphoribosylglycinamide formyltransferase 1
MILKDHRPLRLAVLVSGGGTNLQALIDRSRNGLLDAEIVVVASDRPDAYGLVRAQQAGIPTRVVDYSPLLKGEADASTEECFPVDPEEIDRAQNILRIADPDARLERLKRLMSAEHQLIGHLETFEPDLICLAGFMRLVSPYFIRHYNRNGAWRILNIHPALLPAFPGQHGYEDTFRYGCRWGGITVHFVDEGEDTGPIIAQAAYPVWPEDTIDRVRKRGLSLEYEVYAQCIRWIAAGHVEIDDTSSRTVTRIKDPAYPTILQGWVETLFT